MVDWMGFPSKICKQTVTCEYIVVLQVVMAWQQLARNLELQSLIDMGFSKRYVRCLQISEVVSIMKDLMDFCKETKVGPIEDLKSFPRRSSTTKLQVEQMSSHQGHPADQNALNKLVGMQMAHNNPVNISHQTGGRGVPLGGSAQSAVTLSNYQNMLMRQKSMSSNSTPESPFINNPNQNGSLQVQALQDNRVSGFPNPHLLQQQPPSQGGNQAAQNHMIQQLLQDMNNTNSGGGGGAKLSLSGQRGGSGSITPATGTSPRPCTNGNQKQQF